MQTAILKSTRKRITVWQKDGAWWDERNYGVHASQIRKDYIYKEEDLIMVPTFFTKENEETLKQIREALLTVGYAEVHNKYETFYGVSFDGWLRKGLEDLPCKYEVLTWNHWEGYPWTYFITVDIDELAGGAPSPNRGKNNNNQK